MNTDLSWSLIGRAVAGDPGARDAFGEWYLPLVRKFLEARWRGSRWSGDVDDAVQEVFYECLRVGGALSGVGSPSGDLRSYLHGVARNVARRFEERAALRHGRLEELGSQIDLVMDREPTLSRLFDREWARTMVRMAGEAQRAAARRGSEGARLRAELLRLRFAEGLPIREIAARWRVDPKGVHKAYAKARAEFRTHLQRVLDEHGAEPTGDVGDALERTLRLLD